MDLLVWDTTYVDTYVPSHLAQSIITAGAVANQADDLKKVKYSYWYPCELNIYSFILWHNIKFMHMDVIVNCERKREGRDEEGRENIMCGL